MKIDKQAVTIAMRHRDCMNTIERLRGELRKLAALKEAHPDYTPSINAALSQCCEQLHNLAAIAEVRKSD